MRSLPLAACLLAAGCAAEPVPYHSGNEIPSGPGLLTGPEGAFVLRAGAAAPSGSAAPRTAEEEREYREWREEKLRKESK